MSRGPSRRQVLQAAAVGTGAVWLGSGTPAAEGTPGLVEAAVEGTDARVRLRAGAVTVVLLHAVRRYAYEIAPLGPSDVVGDASGTAVHLRPGCFPAGAVGGFSLQELVVLRDVLASGEGVLAWGGDDAVPDEGLLRADVAHPRLADVAARLQALRGTASGPGGGEGLVFTEARRAQARALQRVQQRG